MTVLETQRRALAEDVNRELNRTLTDKLLDLFERKKKGDRNTDRQYAQVLEARDQLTTRRTH